jgi:Matrixin
MRRRILFAFVLVIAGCVGVAVWWFPRPYSGGTIAVYDQNSGYREQLELAMNVWNRADVGVRFVFTRSRQQANVVVQTASTQREANERCDHGLPFEHSYVACTDWQGRKPFGPTYMILPKQGGRWTTISSPGVVVHEFGHILGLGHSKSKCSVMNPHGDNCQGIAVAHFAYASQPNCYSGFMCTRRGRQQVLCGPLKIDVDNARRLYGGPGSKSFKPYCDTDFEVDIPIPEEEWTPAMKAELLAARATWALYASTNARSSASEALDLVPGAARRRHAMRAGG